MVMYAIKFFMRGAIGLIRNRLELVSYDLKQSRIKLVSILLIAAFVFLFLMLGIMLGVALLIVAIGEDNRVLVLAVLTGAFLLLGVVLTLVLSHQLRKGPRLFEASLSELEKDFQYLSK